MPRSSIPGRNIEIFFADADRVVDVECDDDDPGVASVVVDAIQHDDHAITQGEVFCQIGLSIQQREVFITEEFDLLRFHRVRLEQGIRPDAFQLDEGLITHRHNGVECLPTAKVTIVAGFGFTTTGARRGCHERW